MTTFCKSLSIASFPRSEEHTSELQSRGHLVCRLLLEKNKERRGVKSGAEQHLPQRQHRTVGDRPVAPRGCQLVRSDSEVFCFFFFNDTAPTEIFPLSLHDALPISSRAAPIRARCRRSPRHWSRRSGRSFMRSEEHTSGLQSRGPLVCRLLLAK